LATINFRQLEAFVTVVRAGSFTAAAVDLATQKAHVSRLVSHLEDRLGVRLLQRSTRSLALTEVGRDLYERASGVLGALDATERAIRDYQSAPTGTLKLTCGTEFGLLVVNRWIEEYLARYPAMKIDVDYATRFVDIIHEGFDLAIRLGDLEDSELSARKLGEIDYVLYASPDYLAARGAPKQPEDLDRHDLIMVTLPSRIMWRLSDGTRTFEVTNEPRIQLNNNLAARDTIARGVGIGIVAKIKSDPLVHSGKLVRVLDGWTFGPIPIHALFASSRYLAPKVRTFIDLAIEDMAREDKSDLEQIALIE
jgi:LysR family transcriptional regulator, regulator for bpeEF and oprC